MAERTGASAQWYNCSCNKGIKEHVWNNKSLKGFQPPPESPGKCTEVFILPPGCTREFINKTEKLYLINELHLN